MQQLLHNCYAGKGAGHARVWEYCLVQLLQKVPAIVQLCMYSRDPPFCKSALQCVYRIQLLAGVSLSALCWRC
jgi:hypothetical protein